MSILIVNKKNNFEYAAISEQDALDAYIKEQLVFEKSFILSSYYWDIIKEHVLKDESTIDERINLVNDFIKKNSLKIQKLYTPSVRVYPTTIEFKPLNIKDTVHFKINQVYAEIDHEESYEYKKDIEHLLALERPEAVQVLHFEIAVDPGYDVKEVRAYRTNYYKKETDDEWTNESMAVNEYESYEYDTSKNLLTLTFDGDSGAEPIEVRITTEKRDDDSDYTYSINFDNSVYNFIKELGAGGGGMDSSMIIKIPVAYTTDYKCIDENDNSMDDAEELYNAAKMQPFIS